MNNIVILSFVYLVGIVLLLAFNELNYRRLKVKGEITRKFAHFAACLATVPFPYIFTSHWYILVLALLFCVLLFVTQYSNKLQSIHDIERKSIGSYLLPLSIYLTFYISYKLQIKLIYVLPMVILAICDPMAAILGMNIKKMNGQILLLGHKFNKTWLGSGAFLLTSFVISLIALYFNRELFDLKTFWLASSIALVSTLAEFISWRGSDNLTIPLSVVVMLVLFL
ncbi:phosphatidate cytidylyltransferase [Labilibaculum filiforme]|uniref:Phosphatidate cytidylyltransferase n=1 Tax=Labilibaculum filiforme TaxID=1940526 RepID=A0A2N3HTS2_9BACT|nr:phosphatidate cytidylyltransferase [Labilibaculum filiforme]PKQ61431.1 phosphatidate cytidylyltransferase [Labilibaculum filiforme]